MIPLYCLRNFWIIFKRNKKKWYMLFVMCHAPTNSTSINTLFKWAHKSFYIPLSFTTFLHSYKLYHPAFYWVRKTLFHRAVEPSCIPLPILFWTLQSFCILLSPPTILDFSETWIYRDKVKILLKCYSRCFCFPFFTSLSDLSISIQLK